MTAARSNLDAALATPRQVAGVSRVPRGQGAGHQRAAFMPPPRIPKPSSGYWRQADRNIGIPTGALSGFWVLDVDGDEGEASLRGARSEARPAAGNARGHHRQRRSASLVPLHRPDPVDHRPHRARPRCPRRWRLRHRAAERASERPRATAGSSIRASNSPTRRNGWSGSRARSRSRSPNARSQTIKRAGHGQNCHGAYGRPRSIARLQPRRRAPGHAQRRAQLRALSDCFSWSPAASSTATRSSSA